MHVAHMWQYPPPGVPKQPWSNPLQFNFKLGWRLRDVLIFACQVNLIKMYLIGIYYYSLWGTTSPVTVALNLRHLETSGIDAISEIQVL